MTIKKTMHELCKEFPNKSYRELEIYRDADRQEEAQRIFVQQENEELKEDQLKERGEMKSLRSEVAALKQQLHTDRNEYQNELDRVKKENNDLHNKVAALLDAVDPVEKARESGL